MPLFGQRDRRGCGCAPRLIVALIVAAVSIISYFAMRSTNPTTGQSQHVAGITPEQEIAMGLQARPEMEAQFGGESSDAEAQDRVDRIGRELLRGLGKDTPYQFQFHLLGDPRTINAFALPGGQVFITDALYRKLTTDGQLAGVLGHEIGHVLERHSAEQIAKAQLTQGLTGAAVIATYDPNNPGSRNSAAVAAMIGQLVNMRYGRQDELEADGWGVKLTAQSGYDPRAMIEVMRVLEAASGGNNPPEFLSTHPNPGNRIEKIKAEIAGQFPNGLPGGLRP
jgi:predicted Zn-dependent protease